MISKPFIITDWLPEKPNPFAIKNTNVDVSDIPNLSNALKNRTNWVLILDWNSGTTVLQREENNFLGTNDLEHALSVLRVILKSLRKESALPKQKIPLIIYSQWFLPRWRKNKLNNWDEVMFIARRILQGRVTNEREIVYLAKDRTHATKLKDHWRKQHRENRWAKDIQVRVEYDIRDIIWPIEAHEYPEFIRIPAIMENRMFINEREMEAAEDEAIHGSRQVWKKRKERKKWGIIPLVDETDENIPELLRRITRGKTQINFYGRDYYSGIDLCYPHIDVPKVISGLMRI